MEKIRLLVIGDFVTPTGFSTVNHNIIGNLPMEDYDISVLGVNYVGDPHGFPFNVYPAAPGNSASMTGDLYGINRLPSLLHGLRPEVIYILNDMWITAVYLGVIKKFYTENNIPIPKIVLYFPVDGEGYNKHWFDNADIVDTFVVYTVFGYDVVKQVIPEYADKMVIVPHGTDTEIFHPVDKVEARTKVYPNNPELWEEDIFIVLNANRNQPRKRLDLALLGFAKFAYDKPMSVRYHHHAGLKDSGWDIIGLCRNIDNEMKRARFSPRLEERLIVTNMEKGVQRVSLEHLNNIYNAADIGINTSTGEGWGLTSTEHAATHRAQIVPNHTACSELFSNVGNTIEISSVLYDEASNLKRYIVSPDDLAEKLNRLYKNRELLQRNADAVYEKFTSPTYNWKEIAKIWDRIFKS